MQIDIISDHEDVSSIRPAWEELLEQNRVDTVFLKPEYALTWWKHFAVPGRFRLLIVTMKKGGQVIGIAPLMIVTHKNLNITLRVVKFVGSEPDNAGGGNFLLRGVISRYGNIDFVDFIVRRGLEAEFISALFDFLAKELTSWDMMDLQGLSEGSASLCLLRENAARHGWTFMSRVPTKIFTRQIGEDGLHGYKSSLSKNTISQLNKFERRLKSKYDIRFDLHFSPGDLKKEIGGVIELDRNCKKAKEGKSLFGNEVSSRFYRELLPLLASNKTAVLGTLKEGGNLIAYQLGFAYKGTFYAHCFAYDEKYAYYSPGTWITWQMVCSFIEMGYKNIDFGRGDTDMKKRFRLEGSPFNQAVIYKRRPVPLWLSLMEFRIKPLLKAFLVRNTGSGA